MQGSQNKQSVNFYKKVEVNTDYALWRKHFDVTAT